MKRFLLFASALAGLFLAASCQRETLEPVGGNAVTFTVTVPGGMDTKAIADGMNVDEVHYAVYKTKSDEHYAIDGDEGPLAQGVVPMDAKTATVKLDLLQDQYYTAIFWAQVAGTGYYEVGDLRTITVAQTEVDGNDESRAAFYATKEFNTKTRENYTVTLYRPFSQLNLGTTEESLNPTQAGQTVGYQIVVNESQVVVTGLARTFNTLMGESPAGESVTYTFKSAKVPAQNGEELNVNGKDYHYVAMNYFFVPQNEALVTVSYAIKTDKGDIQNEGIENVPVKKNFRTNIIGNLLTTKAEFEIVVDERFVDSETGELNPDIIVNYEQPETDADGQYVIKSAENLYWLAAAVNGTLPATKSTQAPQTFAGETFVLANDIDLAGGEWTPIGNDPVNYYQVNFRGTLDGKGHEIRNFVVNTNSAAGLFGHMVSGTIKNLAVSNFELSSNHYAGAIVAWAEQGGSPIVVDNCTVKDGKITLQVEKMADGTYDNGDKAGSVVGFAYAGTYTDNVAQNVQITGYRDLGGIAGYVNKTVISNNKVDESVVIWQNLVNGYEESTPLTLGNIYGRVGGPVTTEGNEGAVTVNKGKTIIYIDTVDELKTLAQIVNAGTTYKGAFIRLNADLDLNNEPWTPIGNSTYSFQGTFDGQNHTISNLSVDMAGKSNVGLFGMTTEGEIKNLVVDNAKVVGRLNVAVVSGTPYTSKYTNVKVTGHVEVDGMSYVGAVGGKNAYASWTDVTVDVDETSYVKANSVENGTAYRSYVGGICGFNGEGGHSFTNIRSNINVSGTTCDVGGLFGIAHYGNKFVNCSCSANVEITAAAEAADAEEMGGIAGVWHNGGSNVEFTDCSFTGTLTANITEGVDLTNNTLVGKAYSASGTGKLIVNGAVMTEKTADIQEALESGKDITLAGDVTVQNSESGSNSYGKTGINQTNGGTIDGGGNDFGAEVYGTWDSAINTTGGIIKNINVVKGFRGIFVNHNSTNCSKVYLENVVIDGPTYTISCDQGTNKGLEAVGSTFNGWTSYAATIGDVKFVDCKFGEGAGYSYCRPYAPTEFIGCEFEAGFVIDPRAAVTFENCTFNGVALTSANVSDLVTSTEKVTVK